LLIIESTVILRCGSVVSLPSVSVVVSGVCSGSSISFVPNLIATGINLLYLFNNELILDSSKNSVESSAMCRIISEPLSVLSCASKVNSGDPSHVQCAAGSSLWDLVIISTFSATINAE
jgi:hypothetical protein